MLKTFWCCLILLILGVRWELLAIKNTSYRKYVKHTQRHNIYGVGGGVAWNDTVHIIPKKLITINLDFWVYGSIVFLKLVEIVRVPAACLGSTYMTNTQRDSY